MYRPVGKDLIDISVRRSLRKCIIESAICCINASLSGACRYYYQVSLAKGFSRAAMSPCSRILR